VVVAGSDDLLESGLQGSTTDEEAIDVGLLNQGSGVGVSHGATVQNSSLLSGLLGDVLGEPGSHGRVRLLGLLGGSGLASADGPDGLVSDNDLGPVLDVLADGSELSGVDLVGLVGLSLVELLADAGHHVEAVLEGELGLQGNDVVGLAEDVAALGVAEDDPVDGGVDGHLGGELTGLGTVVVEGSILSGHLHVGAGKGLLHGGDVELGGGHNNLDSCGVEGERLEDLHGEFAGKFKSAIALPVAADKELSHY